MGRIEDSELANELGHKTESLPTLYLELPLGAQHIVVSVWDGVKERFRKRLAIWKRQSFQRRLAYSDKEHFVKYAHLYYVIVVNT